MREYRILHLEDSQSDSDLIKRQLQRAELKFSYYLAKNKESYLKGLDEFQPEIILCDHGLPQFDSLLALEIYNKRNLKIPFILVTGSVSEEYAVAMIKSGIDDYLLKTNLQRLAQAIQNSLLKRENERKIRETEFRLEQSEKRFRSLIEKSADIKILCSPEGDVHYASPSVKTVLGYDVNEFSASGVFAMIDEDGAESIKQNIGAILKTPGESCFIQCRIQHHFGNWVWCEGMITNLLHEPAVNALVLNMRDVTDKRIAEQEREFDRNNMKALINNTVDLMWSVDTDYRLITSNGPFDETVKNTSGRVVVRGMDILSLGFSETRTKNWKGFYERALRGETFTEIEGPDADADMWLETSFYPIYKNDQIIGTACFSRNITERKKAERKLKQQYDQLSEIAFMLSHQARAPIASILGLINLLKFDDPSNPTNIEILKNLQKTTAMFDNVIHQIMQSTREIEEMTNKRSMA